MHSECQARRSSNFFCHSSIILLLIDDDDDDDCSRRRSNASAAVSGTSKLWILVGSVARTGRSGRDLARLLPAGACGFGSFMSGNKLSSLRGEEGELSASTVYLRTQFYFPQR